MAALGRHISSSFEGALTGLRNSVLMMSSLTERLLNRSMQGLLQRDSDLCNLAIADDEEVDFLEKEVDREGKMTHQADECRNQRRAPRGAKAQLEEAD